MEMNVGERIEREQEGKERAGGVWEIYEMLGKNGREEEEGR